MKPTVYVETSVISYRTARPSRDLVVAAHQQLTADWWERALPQLDAYVSPTVLDEIAQGDEKAAQERLAAVAAFGVLELVPQVGTLADQYFAAIDLPEKARADAYHLAMAVWHGMDYLVTWNCQHIAGARIKRVVETVNAGQRLLTPVICTPEELMEV
jgi:predicted nucleic acid-binding protein